MCGIHGVVDPRLEVPALKELLERMARSQGHRGPDAAAAVVVDSGAARVALGFVRLAILDLQGGMQPIEDVSGQSVIACNGQVYNYRELRRQLPGPWKTAGDIEVALRAYEADREGFVHRLNGMYAGAIVDRARQRLVLFNDRFGIKPLYLAESEERLVFASELRTVQEGLAGTAAASPVLDQDSLARYLALGYVPGERTLVSGIRRLPPASIVEVDLHTGRVTQRRYWHYAPGAAPELPVTEAVEALAELLGSAVSLRRHADVPVASLLSAGVDSSAVTALAAREEPDLAIYTVGSGSEAFDERPRTRRFVRDWLGRDLADGGYTEALCRPSDLAALPTIVRHLGEPLALTAILPTWSLFSLVRERHKVVLTGEGADELLGGYGWYQPLREAGPEPDPRAAYGRLRTFFDADQIGRLLGRAAPRGGSVPPLDVPVDANLPALESMLQCELQCRLPASNLVRLDRLAMAHSVEARTPFLDYRIAELAARVSVSAKLGPERPVSKWVLREALRRRDLVPGETLASPKQPFCAPIDELLKPGPHRPAWLDALLALEHPLFDDGIIDREIARRTFARDDGIHSPFTNVTSADRTWNLVVLGAWYQAL